FGWKFLFIFIDIKPARSGARRLCGLRTGTGSTTTGTASQELDALSFQPRRKSSVAFPVRPGLIDQPTDDEHGVSLAQLGAGYGEFTPGGNVHEVDPLLLLPRPVTEVFIDCHAETRDGVTAGRLPEFRVTGEVADNLDFVEGAFQPGLIPCVQNDGIRSTRGDVKDFKPVGVDVEAAAPLPLGSFPGAVVQPAFNEHTRARSIQHVDHAFGESTEYRGTVVPREAAFLTVITDDVIAARQFHLEDGQARPR